MTCKRCHQRQLRKLPDPKEYLGDSWVSASFTTAIPQLIQLSAQSPYRILSCHQHPHSALPFAETSSPGLWPPPSTWRFVILAFRSAAHAASIAISITCRQIPRPCVPIQGALSGTIGTQARRHNYQVETLRPRYMSSHQPETVATATFTSPHCPALLCETSHRSLATGSY